MDTLENNKLIAEFMGFKKAFVRNTKGISYDYDLPDNFELIKETETTIEGEWCEILLEQDYCMIKDLKFHNDWNWLMQVVEKIENSKYVDEFVIKKCSVFGLNVLITPISYDTFNFFHCTLKDETKIQTVYNACVEFIKWYNEQNK